MSSVEFIIVIACGCDGRAETRQECISLTLIVGIHGSAWLHFILILQRPRPPLMLWSQGDGYTIYIIHPWTIDENHPLEPVFVRSDSSSCPVTGQASAAGHWGTRSAPFFASRLPECYCCHWDVVCFVVISSRRQLTRSTLIHRPKVMGLIPSLHSRSTSLCPSFWTFPSHWKNQTCRRKNRHPVAWSENF